MELNVTKRRCKIHPGSLYVSHVVQWTIPHFLRIDDKFLHRDRADREVRYVVSPRFSLLDCDWQMRLYPKGDEGSGGCLSTYVSVNGKEATYKPYAIGCKRADGIVEEWLRCVGSFERPLSSGHFVGLDELKRRRSELLPSGTLTLTCRVDRFYDDDAPHRFRVLQGVLPLSIPFGTVEHFSEEARWQIHPGDSYLWNLHRQRDDDDDVLGSPLFTLAGRWWQLILCPGCRGGHVSLYMRREKGVTASDSRVAFYVGFMRKDENRTYVEGTQHGSTDDFIVEGSDLSFGWPNFLSVDKLRRRRSELLPDNTFEVSLRGQLEEASTPLASSIKRRFGEDVPKDRPMDPGGLFPDTHKVVDCEGNCDVILKVQDKEFRAHRSVLSARSQVFRAMFGHDMAEANTGFLEITDVDPDSFREFLRFLYTGRMREVSASSALSLYVASDKYDVQRLKKFCADYLAQTLTEENFCSVVELSDLHSDERLANAARCFFDRNCRAIAWKTLMKDNSRLAKNLKKKMTQSDVKTPRNE